MSYPPLIQLRMDVILSTQMGSISLVQRMVRIVKMNYQNWSRMKTLVGTLVTAGIYLLIPHKVNKAGRLFHGMTRSRYRIHIYRLWSMTVKRESLVEGCNTQRDEGVGNLILG